MDRIILCVYVDVHVLCIKHFIPQSQQSHANAQYYNKMGFSSNSFLLTVCTNMFWSEQLCKFM